MANGKVYIGQTRQKLKYRVGMHLIDLRRGTHYNLHLQSAWNKYGEDQFQVSVVEECPVDHLNSREEYWVSFFSSDNPDFGYNQKPGGDQHPQLSTPEATQARLEGLKRYYQSLSPEEREERRRTISQSKLGQSHPQSEETKKKISRTKKKIYSISPPVKWTEDQKNQHSSRLQGIKRSEETKKRISEAKKEYWRKKRQGGSSEPP